MQFIKDTSPDTNLITGLADDAIRVGDIEYRQSLILSPNKLICPWPVRSVEEIDDEAWQAALQTRPELLLLGTGHRLVFPQPAQLAQTIAAGLSVEVMDTQAACRTYNLLVHEGRKVTVALILHA